MPSSVSLRTVEKRLVRLVLAACAEELDERREERAVDRDLGEDRAEEVADPEPDREEVERAAEAERRGASATSRASPKSRETSVPNAVANTLRGTASARSSRGISRSTTRNVNRSPPIVTRSSDESRVAAVDRGPVHLDAALARNDEELGLRSVRGARGSIARVPFGERSSRTSASAPDEIRFDWNRSSTIRPR